MLWSEYESLKTGLFVNLCCLNLYGGSSQTTELNRIQSSLTGFFFSQMETIRIYLFLDDILRQTNCRTKNMLVFSYQKMRAMSNFDELADRGQNDNRVYTICTYMYKMVL